MTDAVDDAVALLLRRKAELRDETLRIDRALDALGITDDDGPPYIPTLPVDLAPGLGGMPSSSLRSLVQAAMEAVPRMWTPHEMAAHLEAEGSILSADESIKGIRTAFWSLRNDDMAKSVGVGRGTRTFASKWPPEAVGALAVDPEEW